MCREAGARVSTNVLVRDLDLLPLQHADARQLEVVADVLPLCHGAQIAVDTTLAMAPRTVVVLRENGASLRQARRRKERVHPELSGAHGRARLVVLASEVGGRWSLETQAFLRQFERAKSREGPPTFRTSAKLAWTWRWSIGLHECAGFRPVSLGELCCPRFSWSLTSAEVIGDSRYASFA